MFPFIRDGDLVTLATCRPESIRRGDVVALPHPMYGNLIIHRVIKLDAGRIKTKGDYNPASDGWVDRDQILAHVVRVQRTERDVKRAHMLVQQGIAFVSRFLRMPRIRVKLYKTILLIGELY